MRFKIGEFSLISRVPAKTLRYYDEIGLFSPAAVDRFTGYRTYTADQLPRLNRILALKEMGLSLAEITRLLNEDVSPAELRGMFRLREAEARREAADAQARLARVAIRLNQIEQEGKMPEQDVVIKRIAPVRVLALDQTLSTVEQVGQLFGECWMTLQQQGVTPVGPPMMLYFDEEFSRTDLHVGVAFPVDAAAKDVALAGARALHAETLPALETAACIIHQGPYATIDHTYTVIGQWIAAHGYQVTGSVREIYLTAPDVAIPITEIQFPVRQG